MTEKPFMCPECGNDIPARLIELRDDDSHRHVIGWQCVDCGVIIDNDDDDDPA